MIRISILLLTALSVTAAPTFNRDIAPIIYKNCSYCHRPGEGAPFSLLSYDDVFKKRNTIAKATHGRAMPPWKAEPASYPYRDERRISDKEIALIEEWVKAGAPEGDPSQKPEPPKFSGGWRLGEPDLMIEMPEAYQVPAEGPDIYRNIAAPIPIDEDKWVTAIDMRPSARAAVHHVLYFADSKGMAHLKRQGDQPGFKGMRPGGQGTLALGGWAVGGQPSFFPEGLALKLPKGSDLVIQYHFHPTGKPESEKAQVAFYFAKKPPERALMRIQMPPHYSLFSGLDIPAGAKDFVLRDSYTLPAPIEAVGVNGHAHYIAKVMKLTATLPGGEVKTLLSINDWDFAWQDRYYFEKFPTLPAGTRLDAEIHWDNSAENPRHHSNPPVRVTWGEESKDEMGSISLIAIAANPVEHRRIREDISRREREIVRERLKADPLLGLKLMEMFAE